MSLEKRTHYHSLSNTFPHLCFIRTKCHIKQALKKQAIFKATCELKTKLTPNTKTTTAIYWIEKTKTKKHLHATNNTEVNKRCLSGFCHSVLTQTPDTQSWWRFKYSNTSRKSWLKHLIYTAFAYQGLHMHSRMDWKHSCYSHTLCTIHTFCWKTILVFTFLRPALIYQSFVFQNNLIFYFQKPIKGKCCICKRDQRKEYEHSSPTYGTRIHQKHARLWETVFRLNSKSMTYPSRHWKLIGWSFKTCSGLICCLMFYQGEMTSYINIKTGHGKN